MNEVKKEKLVYIELARIIACLMIIGYHVCLKDYFAGGKAVYSRLMFQYILDDGVTIFWLISGFFIYQNNNYFTLIKKSFIKLWIPATILGISGTFFYNLYLVVIKKANIVFFEVFKNAINGILKFKSFAPSGAHLWFIYIYILLIIVQPITKRMIDFLDNNKWSKILFILLTSCLLIINDIKNNTFFYFDTKYLYGLVPALIISMYGHMLKKEIYRFSKIKKPVIYIFVFMLFIIKGFIAIGCVNNNILNSLEYWYSFYSIIESISIVILCYIISITFSEKENTKILKFGKKTYLLYLFHPYLCKILNKFNVFEKISNVLNVDKYEINVYFYMIITIFLVTALTYLLICLGEKTIESFGVNKQDA